MPDNRGVLREVAWAEIFPWLLLFRTLRLARDPRKLLLAAVAILLTAAGWLLLEYIFVPAAEIAGPAAPSQPWFWNEPGTIPPPVRIMPGNSADWLAATHLDIPWSPTRLAAEKSWLWLTGPFRQLLDPRQHATHLPLGLAGLARALFSATWAMLVWSICAGAITRIAAIELCLEERLPLKAALRHAAANWRGYLGAPLLPYGFLLILATPLFFLGLLMRWMDAGYLIAGLVWPLVLIAGIVMALVMIGLLLGWPLLFVAVSVDGADGFEAFSSTYSYVYQRPLHYGFYVLIGGLLGLASWIVASTFAAVVVSSTVWSVTWGSSVERYDLAGNLELVADDRVIPHYTSTESGLVPFPTEPASTAGQWGGSMLRFWTSCVRLTVLAFGYSFFWTAWTAIYLLLRRDTDAAELDDILVEDRDDHTGLPPLKPDAAGVPVLADTPSPANPAAQLDA